MSTRSNWRDPVEAPQLGLSALMNLTDDVTTCRKTPCPTLGGGGGGGERGTWEGVGGWLSSCVVYLPNTNLSSLTMVSSGIADFI